MKNFKKSFVYFIALSTIFVGCSEDEIDSQTLAIENDSEVIETFLLLNFQKMLPK